MEAEPDNVNAMLALSYDLKNVGYFNEASALADRAIELEPLAAYAYLRKGEASSAAGRLEEAQTAWLKAGEFGNETAYQALATAQLIAGNDDLAADYFETFAQLAGIAPEVFESLIEKARNPESGKAFLDKMVNDVLANASNLGEKVDAYVWYLHYGYLDDYFEAMHKFRGEDNSWTNADALEHLGMTFRASGYTAHPAYMEWVESDGGLDLWDQRGAPDHCQKEDGDWVCE